MIKNSKENATYKMHNISLYLEKVGDKPEKVWDKLGIGYGFHSKKLEQKGPLSCSDIMGEVYNNMSTMH